MKNPAVLALFRRLNSHTWLAVPAGSAVVKFLQRDFPETNALLLLQVSSCSLELLTSLVILFFPQSAEEYCQSDWCSSESIPISLWFLLSLPPCDRVGVYFNHACGLLHYLNLRLILSLLHLPS